MVHILHGNNTIEVSNITKQIVKAITPVYPLYNSIVGITLTNKEAPIGEPEHSYLCLLHQNIVETKGIPLSLKDAYSEAAFCTACLTALFIWPDSQEWEILRDRLCNGNYSNVEIYTDMAKPGPFHALFNYKRLLPGSVEPELLSGWDYSAKHIADERRETWPNAIWVSADTFEAELKKRS